MTKRDWRKDAMALDPTFPHKSHDARAFKKRDCLCEAQNWRCCYCGIRFSDDVDSDKYPSLDHVTPIAAGGCSPFATDHFPRLSASCRGRPRPRLSDARK